MPCYAKWYRYWYCYWYRYGIVIGIGIGIGISIGIGIGIGIDIGIGIGICMGIGIGIGTESSISDIAHHCRGVKCLRAGEDRGQREDREELDFSTCIALPCHW